MRKRKIAIEQKRPRRVPLWRAIPRGMNLKQLGTEGDLPMTGSDRIHLWLHHFYCGAETAGDVCDLSDQAIMDFPNFTADDLRKLRRIFPASGADKRLDQVGTRSPEFAAIKPRPMPSRNC